MTCKRSDLSYTSNFPAFLRFCMIDLTAVTVRSKVVTFICNAECACSKPVTIYQLSGEHQESSSLKRSIKPSFRFIQAISAMTGTLFEPCKFSMFSSSRKTISVVRCCNFKKANHFRKEGDDSEAYNRKGYYGVTEASCC